MKSPSDILTPLLLTIFGRYLCGAGSSGGSLKIVRCYRLNSKWVERRLCMNGIVGWIMKPKTRKVTTCAFSCIAFCHELQ